MAPEREAFRIGPTGGWMLGRLANLADCEVVTHAATTAMEQPPRDLGLRAPRGARRRADLARALGLDEIVCVRQVHGRRVVTAEQARAEPVEADAIMTDEPGVGVMCFSADCPVILAADPAIGAVGAAHASWRGTVAEIAEALIAAMAAQYGCEPGRMLAGIGPSAGPCCYEVGPDVVQAAEDAWGARAGRFFPPLGESTAMDLWSANVEQLIRAGLLRRNIGLARMCTIHDRRFFSYRRQGARAGRFGCVIARTRT